MQHASIFQVFARMCTMLAASIVAAALGVTVALTPPAAAAQAAATPHQSGTVKAVTADGLTLTTAAGQDYTVVVPAAAAVSLVPPGGKISDSATPAKLSDVAVGDKVIVLGTAGDTGNALTARRVILVKSSAIADMHAAEDAAWARGGGGIVKSVDAAAGTVTISSGMKPMTVKITPTTDIKRYANGSVRAQDAVKSTLAAVQPGDQLRVRGAKSEDGSSITADAILVGSFKNYSGLISGVDAAAGTVTLKDLATKKPVTVAISTNSDVRRIPDRMAVFVAARLKGTAPAGGPGAGGPGAGGPPAGGPPTGGAPGGTDEQRAGRARMDLAQMLSHLPAETLAGLKTGEAVMIVAMPSASGTTAVTLLAGVEPILEASPTGQAMTLSPWGLGGDGGAAAASGMPQ